MEVQLKALSADDGHEILEMLREIGPGENGFQNMGYDLDNIGFRDFLHNRMNESRGIGLAPGLVPQTIYWLLIDGRPTGTGKVRDYLSERLMRLGGHIGYCIRPSERGNGYGNIILRDLLMKAKEKGIPRALLTSQEKNVPSRRIIEYNGGRLEKLEGGESYYWIKLRDDGLNPIHIDDYDELYAFWAKIPGLGLGEADSRERIHRFLMHNGGMSFCFVDGGVIVGTVLCGHDSRRGYIYHAAVAEAYRGRGIGRMLIEGCLKKLKDAGVDKCHLFCFKDNDSGNGFWNSTGWTRREDIVIYSQNV